MPGGFCRTSDQRDARAISMGEGARTADVWVIHDTPANPFTLLANQEDVKVRRILGNLPSRAADNLFWLGRYLERAEATLRLVRGLGASLMEAEGAAHGVGATFVQLRELLKDWGALGDEPEQPPALEVARIALHDEDAYGSAIGLAHRARRAAASLRERLSADFWSLLLELERGLTDTERRPADRDRRPRAGRTLPAHPRRPVGPGAGEHEPHRRLALPRHRAGASSGASTPAASPGCSATPTPTPTSSTCCSTSPTARSPIARAISSASPRRRCWTW